VTPGGQGSEERSRAAALRLTSLVLVVATVAAVALGAGPDVDAIRSWMDGTGVAAPAVFVLLYVLLTVALVPGSVLTAAGGLMFGAILGTALTLIGATLGATAVGGSAWLRRPSRRRPSDLPDATADEAADRQRASTPA
jgi:uncharacterized membrane protein YhdT